MPSTRFIDPRSGHGMLDDLEPDARPPIVLISIDMVPVDFYRSGEVGDLQMFKPQ